jgi:hypothetical protein
MGAFIQGHASYDACGFCIIDIELLQGVAAWKLLPVAFDCDYVLDQHTIALDNNNNNNMRTGYYR